MRADKWRKRYNRERTRGEKETRVEATQFMARPNSSHMLAKEKTVDALVPDGKKSEPSIQAATL